MDDRSDKGVASPWARGLMAYGAVIALFHLWFNTVGDLPELTFNALHLVFLGTFGFLSSIGLGPRHRGRALLQAGLALALAASGLYVVFAEGPLHARGETMLLRDSLMAFVLVLLTLTICWRTTGWVVPVLVLLSVTYVVFWGRYVEGVFHFRGLTLTRVLYRAAFTGEGLFGMIASISSSYVFMFILFSSFLLKSGGGDFILRLAGAVMGRRRGGAAYIAVLASGLMGTITGSAVANTVSTGSITIPLMKRSGFSGTFAAATCVSASTGGQLMPPIMGAGAFIMAQWTAQPYAVIMGVALLPALLYFASLLFFVYFESHKLSAQTHEETAPRRGSESWWQVAREGVHVVLAIGTIIGLLVAGYSPTYAAGWSMVIVVGASWLTRGHRMEWREIGESLSLGTRNMVATGVLLVTTGLIIGSLNMTGVSVAFSQLVVEWSGGNLLAALIFIALASLVLGMGLPVTAAYVMLAAVAVPSLRDMGVSLLAGHMIIFWLSQDSNVTPPVCLAAFAGAGVAGSPPMATGVKAWQMSKALYLLPLLFAYSPLIDGTLTEKLWISFKAGMGLFMFSGAWSGQWFRGQRWWQTLLLMAIALMLFCPQWMVNAVGGAAWLGSWIWRSVQRSED